MTRSHITHVAEPHLAGQGALSYATNEWLTAHPEFDPEAFLGTLLFVPVSATWPALDNPHVEPAEDPELAFARLALDLNLCPPSWDTAQAWTYHPTQPPTLWLGPVVTGDLDWSSIGPYTAIQYCDLRKGVRIGANCSIGGAGFGWVWDPDAHKYLPLPHVGTVEIGDGAWIGDNVCIDRARFGVTRIGKNARIDNLVHVAHNVVVGENAVVIACTMLGGSCRVEPGAWVAPAATVRNKVTVGAGAVVGLQANVTKDVPPGATVYGNPARIKGVQLIDEVR